MRNIFDTDNKTTIFSVLASIALALLIILPVILFDLISFVASKFWLPKLTNPPKSYYNLSKNTPTLKVKNLNPTKMNTSHRTCISFYVFYSLIITFFLP